ncbi:MAG: SDR family oxidoreductase [Gammaproteobacteria bacterium]|nr:SDR family oxidoreductase [Gammaproteobacteria bacterium]MDH4253011.1 SDR family oxidoreductase [Gammaproteobacteria bacterium]MDH5308567.1 SDR family oxidoreductase [Gammaproteobacteria bacterium]
MSDVPRLFGSRAIVTGAANGIGEAIVRTFIKQGAGVVAVDSSESGVATMFKALKGVTPMVASVTDKSSAEDLLKNASVKLEGLDIIVNNAAIQPPAPIGDTDEAALDAFLDRRIQLYALMARAGLPFLSKSPAGRIINMGCVRSAFTLQGEQAYRRSQTAIAELTKALAAEAGAQGTTVNYIQPGAIMTHASRRIFSEDKVLRDHCIAHSAAKRLGEALDVAKVALFLASDDAVFVSGAGIAVDGGRV